MCYLVFRHKKEISRDDPPQGLATVYMTETQASISNQRLPLHMTNEHSFGLVLKDIPEYARTAWAIAMLVRFY